MKEALKLSLEALCVAVEPKKGKVYAREFEPIDCFAMHEQAITAIKEALAQPEQEPEFVTHTVEQPYDWSEWVCPDPQRYLMKCCDCGLVHEAEFGVVRYKSETEQEDCDRVDDPNLQAVFRMRRSEQWSPEDTAHRAGGMPMAQPEQEPVVWMMPDGQIVNKWALQFYGGQVGKPLYTTPPQRKPLSDEEIYKIYRDCGDLNVKINIARAIEAAHGIKE